jgi:hypothetical protein
VTLLLKLLLAPALVVGSSLAGRRWGPEVSGTLVALPIVAGPILLITGLEQGTAFGARAAASALLGLVSLALFAVVFAHASRYTGWVGALAVSWMVCLAADLGLARLAWPAWLSLPFVLLCGGLAAKALPRAALAGPEPPRWPWWDLPGRAVATAALVLVVTGVAATVGPRLTGVLAPFPIATSVVAGFVLAQQGTGGAIRTLRGVPRGLVGFAVFCCLVAVLVRPLGTAAAFLIAGASTVTLRWSLDAALAPLRSAAQAALAPLRSAAQAALAPLRSAAQAALSTRALRLGPKRPTRSTPEPRRPDSRPR